MGRKIKLVIAILVFLASIIVPAIALQTHMPMAGNAPASRALFVEHSMIANGTVISGEAHFRSVNFPSYWYNENTRQLNGKADFPINDSLVLVFGDALTLKGNFGAGTGNKLYGVYALPTYADKAYIYLIDRSGNMAMRLNGKAILLAPGKSYEYSENETVRDGSAIIEIRYTHIYTNHGFIDKRKIGTDTSPPPVSPRYAVDRSLMAIPGMDPATKSAYAA